MAKDQRNIGEVIPSQLVSLPPPPPPRPAPRARPGWDDKRQPLRIPISPGNDAVIYLRFPMTEADWEQFMTVLTAMKPGLVRAPVRLGGDEGV